MRNQYEVAWYHLRSGELELLIAAEKDKTGRKLLLNYNPYATRLKTTADAWVTRTTLVISGVTESDSGLYFCGTKSDAPEMLFDKPIRLEIEGNRFQFLYHVFTDYAFSTTWLGSIYIYIHTYTHTILLKCLMMSFWLKVCI